MNKIIPIICLVIIELAILYNMFIKKSEITNFVGNSITFMLIAIPLVYIIMEK